MNGGAHVTLRRVADAAPQPWRNGGGSTRELLAWPPGGAWQLRISVAEIAADGPFSAYEGVQRWFAVIDGAGVVLGFADGERRLEPGAGVLQFDGADAPACRLIDGPTHDLNLMLRSGVRGTLERVPAGEAWNAPWRWRAVFTAGAARLHAAGAAPVDLAAGTLAHPLPPGPCRIEPNDPHAPAFWIGADLALEARPGGAARRCEVSLGQT